MSAEKQLDQWGQIIAKTWQDAEFKQRVIDEPAVVMKEFGLPIPAGVELRVLENTDRVVHLTLPASRRDRELSDDELEGVAGGVVTIEYLVLGTFLALALIVGVTSVSSNSGAKQPQPQPSNLRR